MTVLDLWVPDDLPLTAERDLGQALAAVTDRLLGTGECLVWVHRLPAYGVVSAEREGIRTIRVRVDHLTDELALALEQVVRAYLAGLEEGKPTLVRITS